ncbi:MAG: DNA methylase, partial [Proteobacteria bacterium]|nr:DNA methylase [Pseudomonadota bacterium]
LAVLRKRTSTDTAFLDELYPQVDAEVKRQLDEMRALEDARDPSFADADYQLAAYAAALKVLTAYSSIEDFDVVRELSRERKNGETSPIAALIEQAVTTACNHLIPEGVEPSTWRQLSPAERYYLKGLDLESRGEAHIAAYQELARGFGFTEYKPIVSLKANDAHLLTASELARKEMGAGAFGTSLVRHGLFAVFSALKAEDAREGRNWLKNEVPDYWSRRTLLIDILRYLGRLEGVLDHWTADAAMAVLIAGALENDHV